MAYPLMSIEGWSRELGLLPVPLLVTDRDPDRPHVMLNGSVGNFCVGFSDAIDLTDARNIAWSADVGHFLQVRKEGIVEVVKWDSPSIERYSIESVSSNLHKFHHYLVSKQPSREMAVVSHLMRTYRSMRAHMAAQNLQGYESLLAFLCLIAEVTGQQDTSEIVLSDWGIPAAARDILRRITPNYWRSFIHEITDSYKRLSLEPRLELVLRHASGQLFQEAHYETNAVDVSQITLPGIIPQPAKLSRNTSSVGVHYTPPALARTLIEEALYESDIRGHAEFVVFDPACGSGEFLKEAIRQISLRDFTGNVHLIGWDISESACAMANFVMSWETRGMNNVSFEIACKNALVEPWPKNVVLIAMNPPFLSWQDMKIDQREMVASHLGQLSTRKPDMASAFLKLASERVVENGVVGSILPGSILVSDSALHLRKYVTEQLNPKLTARFGSQAIFPGATVDAAIFIGKRNQAETVASTVLWSDYRDSSTSGALRALRKERLKGVPNHVIDEDGFSIYQVGATSSDIWFPRPYHSWKLQNELANSPKVKDRFDVMQGVRLGLKDSFLVSKEYYDSLPKRERKYFRPAVANRSIRNGVLNDSAYIFYPYDKDGLTLRSEDELEKHVPQYAREYLFPFKEQLLSRARVKEDEWWRLSERRAWQAIPIPKIVTTYFGRAGSFAWDGAGEYIVNQGFGWLPNLPSKFSSMPDNIGHAYVAILSSEIINSLLAANSSNVGGGQWNLSKKFIDKMPLPDLFDESMDSFLLEELYRFGLAISNENEIDNEKLSYLVEKIYYLSK